jgi:predicted RNase H-like nuclease
MDLLDVTMKFRLVGSDCATDYARVGLALGLLDDDRLTVVRALLCTRRVPAITTIAHWLEPAAEGCSLLAFDAPLGWPAPLSAALVDHRAGKEIIVTPNEMFRRTTDRIVQKELGITPLDVGADRIARTAHAALHLMGDLHRRLKLHIPLAWEPNLTRPYQAIEVYPAATLKSHGFRSRGYKEPGNTVEREMIISSLRTVATVQSDVANMQASADTLDAAVCLLAAADFLRCDAIPVTDRKLAEREGWIWVRDPKAKH